MLLKVIIIFFGMLFCVDALADNNTSKQFELTRYSNGKSTFFPHTLTNASTYTPDDTPYEIHPKPKIVEHRLGTMYIYNLSVDNKLLNVISFESLALDANVENIEHIALADENYFNKDDNFPVTLVGNKVQLSSLYKNIDLTHLKFLIVVVKKDKKIKLNKLTFYRSKDILKEPTLTRATWVWKPLEVTLSLLKKQNIKQIYMQMTDGFDVTIKTLRADDIMVYGLNGSASDVHDYAHLISDIEKLGKLTKIYPHILGYQVDIEPYLLPEFQENKHEILKKYLHVLEVLKDLAHEKGLKFSVVIPFWFDSIYYEGKNLGFLVSEIADEIVLMSYRSDLNLVHNISKTLLSYAELSKTNIRIGIELMHIEDEHHTLYEDTNKTSACRINDTFSKECRLLKELRSYTLKGSSISFYNQLEKLKYLDLNNSIHTSTFRGYVLHHYGELHKVSIDK